MKIRNKTLYNKIRKFMIASVKLLQEKYPSNEDLFPFIQYVRRYFIQDDGVTWENDYQIDMIHLLFSNSKTIEELSEFTDCAKYLLKNPTTRRALGWRTNTGQPSKKLPLELHFFTPLSFLLSNHLTQMGNLSFNEEVFIEFYLYFEKSIYKTTIRRQVTAPLINFSCDVDEINFGEGFKIRKITDEEKIRYYQRRDMPFSSMPLDFWEMRQTRYTLEKITIRPREEIYSRIEGQKEKRVSPQEVFNDILTTLRLFKQGSVVFYSIDTIALDWTPHGGIASSSDPHRRRQRFGPSYTLSESAIHKLLGLWRRFKRYKKLRSKRSKYIDLALQRFHYGIDEVNKESKILDYFISFEALCLPERGELTYRLSNRIAILLDTNSEEANQIRKFMVKAYGVRSQIIHGEEVKPIQIDDEVIPLNQITQRIEEYLRLALQKFIVLSPKYKRQSIISILDESLIDKTKRKHLTSS